MAVDDAYNAKEWREPVGGDELAFRTERISRATCRAVAEFAFHHAERTKSHMFGGPKYTVSRIYEGMFKEEMDAAAARHPDVAYEPQLIDATYALLFSRGGDPLVIPALNRDGDCLSDLVLQLFGSIAGAESLLLGFRGESLVPSVVMAEAPHGTAPALQGKNIANPMAMILAGRRARLRRRCGYPTPHGRSTRRCSRRCGRACAPPTSEATRSPMTPPTRSSTARTKRA